MFNLGDRVVISIESRWNPGLEGVVRQTGVSYQVDVPFHTSFWIAEKDLTLLSDLEPFEGELDFTIDV